VTSVGERDVFVLKVGIGGATEWAKTFASSSAGQVDHEGTDSDVFVAKLVRP